MALDPAQVAEAADVVDEVDVVETTDVIESPDPGEVVGVIDATEIITTTGTGDVVDMVEIVETDASGEVIDVVDVIEVMAIEAAESVSLEAPSLDEEPVAPVAAAPRKTVGDAIAEQLWAAGARVAYTVPGESFLGLMDGLLAVGIKVIATRHEGAAAYMAEAATQLTGRPQLVIGTRAVGAANMAIGIHTARADSTPMIALVGQVKRANSGREAFQEVDLVGSIGRLAKWAVQIDEPARASATTYEAISRAMGGRPGPVLISIPEDVLDMRVPAAAAPLFTPRVAAVPDPDDVKAVVRLIAASRRGVIIGGAGVLRANATRRLMRLAEALGVPVMTSWRRPDAAPNSHPLYLGMTGLSAPHTVLERLKAADVVLVLGSRLSEMTTFAYRIPSAGTRWAHVDLDPRPAGTGRGDPAISLTADVGRFVDAALSLLRAGVLDAENRQSRLDATALDREAYVAAVAASAETEWEGPGIHPGRVVATLGRLLPVEAVLTTDAGNFAGWLARGYRFRRPGTFLGPTSGAMGYALPAAIAAAHVYPRRSIVALAGDGGFAMTMAELETAVREDLAVIALVFDNQRYGTIRMHQDREGRRPAATDLGPVDFVAIARGLGADGVTVDRDDQVADAIEAALASRRPTVIHLMLDRRWISVDQPATVPEADQSERDIASAP